MGAGGRRLDRASSSTERRLPTLDEINAAAPDTPVFVLHLYDRALLNGAALRACGYTTETPLPPGGEIVRDSDGNPTGLLLARPNARILYATLEQGPKLPFEYQVNSTRHFMRELNRLGVTGAIDAGGGFQNYPEDYAGRRRARRRGQLTVRHRLQPVHAEAQGGEGRLRSTGRRPRNTSRATITTATTAAARCWSSRRPISRISANRAPTCRRKWKAS